jgi:hypothetical protein
MTNEEDREDQMVPYTELTIRYDRKRLWWVVERDGVYVASGPTGGSVTEDARQIENRLEVVYREQDA